MDGAESVAANQEMDSVSLPQTLMHPDASNAVAFNCIMICIFSVWAIVDLFLHR